MVFFAFRFHQFGIILALTFYATVKAHSTQGCAFLFTGSGDDL